MKILLIKPYFTINTEDAQTYGFFPPMGLAYIASVLEQNNFTVKIIDCQLPNKKIRINKNVGLVKIGISDNEIKNIIKEFAPM